MNFISFFGKKGTERDSNKLSILKYCFLSKAHGDNLLVAKLLNSWNMYRLLHLTYTQLTICIYCCALRWPLFKKMSFSVKFWKRWNKATEHATTKQPAMGKQTYHAMKQYQIFLVWTRNKVNAHCVQSQNYIRWLCKHGYSVVETRTQSQTRYFDHYKKRIKIN